MVLVLSQSIYACTVVLQSVCNQFTCILQLLYCLIDFTVSLLLFCSCFRIIFTVMWTGRTGQVGRAGRGPGQAGRGLRLVYSDFTN